MTNPTTKEIVARCQKLYEDLHFTAARDWKAAEKGRKVIGYLPVYIPRELIHAAGMLPLGIMGGGDNLEVIHGEAAVALLNPFPIELVIEEEKLDDDNPLPNDEIVRWSGTELIVVYYQESRQNLIQPQGQLVRLNRLDLTPAKRQARVAGFHRVTHARAAVAALGQGRQNGGGRKAGPADPTVVQRVGLGGR